jgi:hypothetical protein
MRASTLDGGAFARLFAAWEKSAAAMAGSAARDPRTLEIGAGVLKAQLAWVRALEATAQAFMPLLRREES